jgi:hypothetical protein
MPYQSRHAGRLADLLMQQGDIAAQRAQQSGDMWAGVARGLGSIPAGIQARRAAEQEAFERQQDRVLKRRDVESQIGAREAQIAKQIQETQTEEEARRTAGWTRATIGVLSEYAQMSPEEQRTAWPAVQSRLASEGGWEPEQIPKQPMPTGWVKGQLLKFMPVDKAYGLLFPEQKAPEPFTLSPGQTRFDPSGAPIANVEPKPEPVKPDTRSLPLQANEALRRGDRDEYSRIMRVLRDEAAATRAPQTTSDDPGPLETIIGPDGKPIRVPRSQAIGKAPASGTEKASSGVQKRVLNFFNRAQQADVDLEGMEPQIQEIGLAGQTWQALAPNFLQTQLGQQYTAAQRAFTEARLRKDSGAAIPEQEFANDRQTYFVQPGDSKETLEQKRRARAAMLASLAFESGQALGEYVGDADEARKIVEGYKSRAKKAGGRTRVIGPNGETGTVPAGTALPPGWNEAK